MRMEEQIDSRNLDGVRLKNGSHGYWFNIIAGWAERVIDEDWVKTILLLITDKNFWGDTAHGKRRHNNLAVDMSNSRNSYYLRIYQPTTMASMKGIPDT